MASRRSGASVTRQQRVALEFARQEGDAYDWGLWNEGVRPWPTIKNLAAKGLIEIIEWGYFCDEEQGYVYRLTPAGEAVLDAV
jgi:hypothetical protein